MVSVHHRSVEIDGLDVFYREAGDPADPAIVLLHGYPTSSFMFRHLIPLLANDHHVIAPDLIGFGQSSAPTVDEFDYTFDRLAAVTEQLLDHLAVDRYAIYVQDYGAPIGWRLALRRPDAVTAVVSQNGNAYEEGFVDSFWGALWTYSASPTAENAPPLVAAQQLEAVRWQYTHGVPDPSVVSPDTWWHDLALLGRPGIEDVQLKLFADYSTNVDLYPRVHEYFRKSQVPLLAVWGENDEIFGPDGARAFQRDLPQAQVHLLDGGHFLLESHLDEVSGLIRDFLAAVIARDHAQLRR